MENKQPIIPFFTLPGTAEKALHYYVDIFPQSKILSLDYFQEGQMGEPGKVLSGLCELKGMQFMLMDMSKEAVPAATWGISFLYHCDSETEFDHCFAGLKEGGTVLMGPEAILEMKKVAWVTDPYGITWQLIWS